MMRYVLPAVVLATPALADPEDYGHMMHWGYGPGMIFAPILWLVVLGLVAGGVIWFVRSLDHGSPRGGKSSALAELDMRLARGEIDAEDYAARKKLLAE